MKPVAIDLFAGGGGTTLGLRRAGFDVRVAVEKDETKASTLLRNHHQTMVLGIPGTHGDVRLLKGRSLSSLAGLKRSRLDLLVACPPCQGFSTRGKREIHDPRNRLYVEFVRIASEMRPRAVVFENVPGIAILYHGKFLGDLGRKLEKIGYRTAVWHLHGRDLGIPQARERVFVIGLRNRQPGSPPKRRRVVTVWEAIGDLPVSHSGPALHERALPYRSKPLSAYAASLRGRNENVTGCERTRHQPYLVRRFRSLRWLQWDPSTRHRRLHPNQLAPTLTAGSRTQTACRPVHPYADRVLTIREAARIASFPDWYRFPVQTAEAWSQIGNAVPPLMGETVFRRVRSFLGK